MSISLVAVDPRSNRRIRLAFSEALAAGAFTSTAPYSVSCTDGTGVSPSVVAAFVVPDSPHVVELAVGADLTDGAVYEVSAVGVPASGGGSTLAGTSAPFRRGVILESPRVVDTQADDLLAELYGEDLAHDGNDIVEDASGDLGKIGGVANVEAAASRGLLSEGLEWDDSWGAKLRRFVDAPYASAGEMRGVCIRQLLRDDRVRRASVAILPPEDSTPEDVHVESTMVLLGDLEASTSTAVRTA